MNQKRLFPTSDDTQIYLVVNQSITEKIFLLACKIQTWIGSRVKAQLISCKLPKTNRLPHNVPICRHVWVYVSVRKQGWEGEQRDAGSCAGGELSCRSSGKGGAERSSPGQRTESQLETQTVSSYWKNLPRLIMFLQSRQNFAELGDVEHWRGVYAREGAVITCEVVAFLGW